MKWLGLVLSLTLSWHANALTSLTIDTYQNPEFNPSNGERFEFSLKLTKSASVKVQIYSPDRDIIRLLKSQLLKAGTHTFTWDGRDDSGETVPNEAYLPVVTAEFDDGSKETLDPREQTGGEVVEDLQVEVAREGDIYYHLPAPSRVLVRAGIKGGPMYINLASWEPRVAGKNVQRWNGFDADQLVDLRGQKNLKALVAAYRLPDYSILTFGNTETNYAEYRRSHDFETVPLFPGQTSLVRNGERLSRQYFLPRNYDLEPDVELSITKDVPKTDSGIPIIYDKVPVRVNIPKGQRWRLQESQYEVAFYVNHEFVSEEEQGYVPLTWLWKPVGLAPGQHLLTVNISGFRGQVAVASLLFYIPDDEADDHELSR